MDKKKTSTTKSKDIADTSLDITAMSSGAFSALQQSYESWISMRKVSIKLFGDLLNARSKASHVRQTSITALGLTISSNRISTQVFDEISDLINALEEVQRKMNDELEKITAIQLQHKEILPIAEDSLADTLQQLQQQSHLESTLRRRLVENAYTFTAALDHDLSVTMMACFTNPPYLRKDDIGLIVELGKKKDK